MPQHESPSSSPPATPSRRRVKSCARKCEQLCCTIAIYFPLAFVYSLTTWAVWTDTGIGFRSTNLNAEPPLSEKLTSVLGVVLYIMLNTCYTVASFTDPGSPSKSSVGNKRGGKYSILPTTEPIHDLRDVQTITVSSTGSARYCKKCHVPKPDRAHHCSTCKRCVLKMDHHCPWLATCLGLHNYKAFVLFLVYTSIFCWVCFINSSLWVWSEIFASSQYVEEFAPVNVIMLAVISGIIGLVLTGFTCWHIYLCMRGQTTIECLEKTRYLSKVRHRVEQNRQEQQSLGHKRGMSEGGLAETIQRAGEQLLEFHANAVPGASRYEEGEEHSSPTPSFSKSTLPSSKAPGERTLTPSQTSQYNDFPTHENASPAERALRRNYSTYEADRERERYEEFLEDKESQKMPNAFDLGWRKNLGHLFGPVPLFWFLPVCNTTGDGWRWEVSSKWLAASEDAARRKEERIAAARERGEAEHEPRLRVEDDYRYPMDDSYSQTTGNGQIYGRSAMSMQTFDRSNTRRQRHDFDASGADGEVGSFEVSDDSSESSSPDANGDTEAMRRR